MGKKRNKADYIVSNQRDGASIVIKDEPPLACTWLYIICNRVVMRVRSFYFFYIFLYIFLRTRARLKQALFLSDLARLCFARHISRGFFTIFRTFSFFLFFFLSLDEATWYDLSRTSLETFPFFTMLTNQCIVIYETFRRPVSVSRYTYSRHELCEH